METEKIIFGEDLSKVCFQPLEKIIFSDGECPSLYALADHPKGDESRYGKIYEACCSGNCEFIAKWLPKKYKNAVMTREQDILSEIEFQNIASSAGIAPKIHDVWECKEGFIIVMDALEKTAHGEIVGLDWEDPDQRWKIMGIVSQLYNLLDTLHGLDIIHGDAHLSNFMVDKLGIYKIIDFGKARRASADAKYEIAFDNSNLESSLDSTLWPGWQESFDEYMDTEF